MTNPRAIMFDPGPAKQPVQFAISFNGDSSQRQFANLEIMKFDVTQTPEKQIEFIDIHFDAMKAQASVTRNPPVCFSCHQFQTALARPLWDARGFHPNAYGDQNSIIFDLIGPEAADGARWFAKTSLQHPRYKFLGPLDIQVNTDSMQAVFQIKSQVLQDRNNTFGARLAIVNRRRLVKFIIESKEYATYRYAIAGAFLRCESIPEFLPPTAKKNHLQYFDLDKKLHPPLINEQVKKLFQQKKDLFNFSLGGIPDIADFQKEIPGFKREFVSPEIFPYYLDIISSSLQWGGADELRTASLRWLFEPRRISMRAWGMDSSFFSQGFYRFINYEGDDLREDLTLLLQEILKVDSSLKTELRLDPLIDTEAFIREFRKVQNEITCKSLQTRSLKSFDNAPGY